MRNLPFEFIARKNKIANPNAWVWLFQLNVEGDDCFFLTNNNECIEFNGIIYDPYPIEIQNLPSSLDGDELETTITLSNVDQGIAAFVDTNEGLIDKKVNVLITNIEDPFSEAYTEFFSVVDCSVNQRQITLTVSYLAISDQDFPGLYYIKDFCRWEFGSTECGFDLGLLNPGETCTKRLNGSQGCNFWGDREVANAQTRQHPQRFGAFPFLSKGVVFEV